jgi:FixJ family two-component response regulator
MVSICRLVAVERTDMPVIFITGLIDVGMAVQAMKAGAVEFLTKPFGDEALLAAIRQALERSRAVLGHQAQMRTLWSCYASLTCRERQVVALVVAGLLNKQAAGELGISEITVKAHRGQVTQKMKAGSLAELVKMPQGFPSKVRQGLRRLQFPVRAESTKVSSIPSSNCFTPFTSGLIAAVRDAC